MKKFLDRIRQRNPLPVLIVYFTVGVVGLILPLTRPLFTSLIPTSLLLSSLFLIIYHGPTGIKFWLTMAGVMAAGYLVELVGVNTGILFGSYTYGETLGPSIGHTPLIMGLNWWMLLYCTSRIVAGFSDSLYFRSIMAATLMVIYDIPLEPYAVYFDMWDWGGPVPLQNYLAWFVISLVLHMILYRWKLMEGPNKVARPLFFIQMVFFLILNGWFLVERLWV